MKKFLFCILCMLLALSLSINTPMAVIATEEAAKPSAHFLNHREHDGIELFKGYMFSDDRIVYFSGNDMFYNISDNGYSYNRCAKTMYSYWAENSDGTYTRVEPQAYRVHYSSASGSPYYDKEQGKYIYPDWDNIGYTGPNNLIVENYSADIKLLSTKSIPLPLPIFGGFFSGKDYNFVVVGQENPDSSDSAEVLRFLKYSKTWELLGQQSVYGANTSIPFDAGCLRMTEAAGVLYVHTSHEMYSGHQANMTFSIEQSTMTLKEQNTNVWNLSSGYVSHSFNQFIDNDGTYLYRVDHGDAYPRSVVVVRSNLSGSIKTVVSKEAFVIKQGTTGNNDTGVAIGGFAIGNNNLVIAGGTEDQENSANFGNKKRNIFLSIVDKNLGSANTVMLTNYATDGTVYTYPPQLVQINGNCFLVMWEEYDSSTRKTLVRAVTVDEKGNMLSEISSHPMRLSDCQPVLCSDGSVKWYVSTGDSTLLYSIVPENLAASLVYGDVNNDGSVDSFDALLMLKHDAGLYEDIANNALADVNLDGDINALDASLVLQYDARLIEELPKG